MDWKEMTKWSVLMITSGIVTAVAIEFITGYARQQAAQAARAELQQIMIAASKFQPQQTTSSQQASTQPTQPVFFA
jgi:Tfp pilus assembly protein PilE